jgi:hypothetical protein
VGILRSELLAALNDLYRACDESANRMQAAADAATEFSDLAHALNRLAQACSDWADSVSAAVKRADDVPHESSGEAQLADQVLTSLRAKFSDDEVRALLDGCTEAGGRVAESAAAALALEEEPEPQLRELLGEMLSRSSNDVDDLRQRLVGAAGNRR